MSDEWKELGIRRPALSSDPDYPLFFNLPLQAAVYYFFLLFRFFVTETGFLLIFLKSRRKSTFFFLSTVITSIHPIRIPVQE
jgi:hypothetical protein